jgi:hypothetical protein
MVIGGCEEKCRSLQPGSTALYRYRTLPRQDLLHAGLPTSPGCGGNQVWLLFSVYDSIMSVLRMRSRRTQLLIRYIDYLSIL